MRVRQILQDEGPVFPPAQGSSVICQFSSFSTCDEFLRRQLRQSFSAGSSLDGSPLGLVDELEFVWPTVDEVRNGVSGYRHGGSMPAHLEKIRKVPAEVLRTWSSPHPDGDPPLVKGRRAAMPHLKSFMRASGDGRQLHWMCLTSANMSAAAWGRLQKQDTQIHCCHWELGVLFTPRTLSARKRCNFSCNDACLAGLAAATTCRDGKNEDTRASVATLLTPRGWEVNDSHVDTAQEKEQIYFPVPFALPTSQYTNGEFPFHTDGHWPGKPDRFGLTSVRG